MIGSRKEMKKVGLVKREVCSVGDCGSPVKSLCSVSEQSSGESETHFTAKWCVTTTYKNKEERGFEGRWGPCSETRPGI